jgi:hypothetical protein
MDRHSELLAYALACPCSRCNKGTRRPWRYWVKPAPVCHNIREIIVMETRMQGKLATLQRIDKLIETELSYGKDRFRDGGSQRALRESNRVIRLLRHYERIVRGA